MLEIRRDRDSGRNLRVAVVAVAAGVVAVGLAVLVVKRQIARHRRDLFSSSLLDRLAALGYMGREPASVSSITLLKDYISWERHGLLRGRARVILNRMEADALAGLQLAGEKAG